jgi:hypothetical protein
MAVMVSLKVVPAVWDDGVGTVKEFKVVALTVKLVDVPVTELWVAVSVVDWAS